MRTDSPSPAGLSLGQIRAGYARARRRVLERAPVWARSRGLGLAAGLALAGVGALAVLYAGIGNPNRATTAAHVLSGEEFSPDDLIRVRKALQAKQIWSREDVRNRVEVASERLAEANEVVAKLDLGPKPLDERERQARDASPFESPSARERRDEQARLDQLGEMIRRLDPATIAGARVKINRPSMGLGPRRTAAATAFVYVDTLEDREINPLTIESVVGMVASFAPEVRQDAVSLWDRKGRHYADARDPAIAQSVRERARAWELGREIQDKLDWIKGVQVSVHLVPTGKSIEPHVPGSDAIEPFPPSPLTLPPLPEELPPPPPAEEVRLVTPNMGVNQPLDLDERAPVPEAASTIVHEPIPPRSEPPPRPAPATSSPPAPSRTNFAENAPPFAPPPAAPAPTKVQVWVKVPRSFYLKVLQKREPSMEELQTIVSRTEDAVRTAVEHVVPSSDRGEVRINTIPDDWTAPPPARPVPTSAERPWPWWIHAVAGAAAMALGIALGSRLLGGRRAALRSPSRTERGHFKIDEATDPNAGPGPSERVRELIRLNPDAAASVLLRWTGHGGESA